MGTVNKAQLSEGESDVLSRVIGDTAHPAVHFQGSLHQQVGVIAPQIGKHHGMLVVLGFSRSLRLQALWSAPRYSPVMWQWSRTELPSRGLSHTWHVSTLLLCTLSVALCGVELRPLNLGSENLKVCIDDERSR